MRVIFYKFPKKPNSLKIPVSGSGTELDCQLLESCSLSTPSIIVANIDFKYTYCYIPDFGRYYFVHDAVIIAQNRYQYNLVVDVLASFRNNILDSSLYVKRSATSYNLFLPDDTWCHTTNFTESVTPYALSGYNAQGCYLVQVVSDESQTTANPASTMYAMTPSNLSALLAYMFDKLNYSNLTDFDMTATYFNPFQYITSCRWYPFSVNDLIGTGQTLVTVKYGWWEATGVQARLVTSYGKTISQSIALPANNDWTDKDSNWSRLSLFVPSCGLTEIDTAFCGQTLTCKMDIDFNTGKTFVTLTTGANQVCATLSGEIGAEVGLNQISTQPNIPTSKEGLLGTGLAIGGATLARNPKGVLNTIINFGKTAFTSLPVGGLVGALNPKVGTFNQNANALINSGKEIASDVGDAILQTLLNPTVTSAGADGCRYTQNQNHNFILYRRKYTHYNSAISKLGGVCNRVETLRNLSGYTVVANGIVEINGTQEEKNAICNLLEGGFYIE